jgi:hypothetical protein
MQAYKIMARNTRTGQRIQQQFLDGYLVREYEEACRLAENFAHRQQQRSPDSWIGEIDTYTAKNR